MRIFISGGSKSGKSHYAQKLAKLQAGNKLYYIATMLPADKEDEVRIRKHRLDREGWSFQTIEQPTDIEAILQKCDLNGSFLIDSLTALMANEMFATGNVNTNAPIKIINGLGIIFDKIKNIVIVSDYIYSDAYCYDDYTEGFRRSLAQADRFCAKTADIVIEFSCGIKTVHKGLKELGKIDEEAF